MDEPETLTRSLKAGDVVLLENLRFESGEETDDQQFAQKLSMIGDFYVNDALDLSIELMLLFMPWQSCSQVKTKLKIKRLQVS